MKTKLFLFITVLFAALFLSACATTPTLEQKVIGAYGRKIASVPDYLPWKVVFLDNATVKLRHSSGRQINGKWKIVAGPKHECGLPHKEVHVKFDWFTAAHFKKNSAAYGNIYSINPDDSITHFAYIRDGRRRGVSKDEYITYNKIK